MGYVTLFCTCVNCGQLFAANPDLVPSVRVRGVKEPVCRPCMERYKPDFQIPPGAYEPGPEYPDESY